VIEFRVAEPISAREGERLRDRFKRRYEKIELLNTVQIEVTGSVVKPAVSVIGYKLTSAAGTDVLILNLEQMTIGTIRMAPYYGWDKFVAAARENFDEFTKIVGRRRISRIGVRFTNRIDAPGSASSPLGRLFNLGISYPADVAGNPDPYYLSFNALHPGTKTWLIVQHGVMQPPALLDHTSFLLDIDAYIDSDIPQRLDEMWGSVEVLHTAKNAVFESCITDECRALFL
jgi:uncharacterized protein (TIGR04255 family)